MHDGDHLSEAAVRRVIERTAALDATLGRTLTVAQLRSVVRDAGFSDASLRVALAELAVELPRLTAPHAPWWRRAFDGAWRLSAVIGSVGATMAVLGSIWSIVRRLAGAPLADAVAVASILLGLGAGFLVAKRFRSRLGQLLTAGLGLAVLVDTLFGWSGFLVNGRSAKFAEMAAAVVGVALGMWLSRRERHAPPAALMAAADKPVSEEHRMSRVWFVGRTRGLPAPAL